MSFTPGTIPPGIFMKPLARMRVMMGTGHISKRTMKNTRNPILLALAAAFLTPLSGFAGPEEKKAEAPKSECPDCKKEDGECTKCDEKDQAAKAKCPVSKALASIPEVTFNATLQ